MTTETTTKPGVLAELDALIERNRLSMRGDSERALIDIRDAVERLAEAAERLLVWADPWALPCCDRNEKDVAEARAALAAFRGEQP